MHLLAYACIKLPFADDNVYSYLSLVFVVVKQTWSIDNRSYLCMWTFKKFEFKYYTAKCMGVVRIVVYN